jgi:hypothetical protein
LIQTSPISLQPPHKRQACCCIASSVHTHHSTPIISAFRVVRRRVWRLSVACCAAYQELSSTSPINQSTSAQKVGSTLLLSLLHSTIFLRPAFDPIPSARTLPLVTWQVANKRVWTNVYRASRLRLTRLELIQDREGVTPLTRFDGQSSSCSNIPLFYGHRDRPFSILHFLK